jgi:hypothetical protein
MMAARLLNQPVVIMNRLLLPTLLTGALLILAVTLSVDLSGHLDSHIACADFMRAPKSGCKTNLGSTLSLVWGFIAGLIGLIWLRYEDL